MQIPADLQYKNTKKENWNILIPILISAISFHWSKGGGTTPFFPSITGTMRHQLFPLKWGNKNVVRNSPIQQEKHGNQQEICKEKGKKLDGYGCMLQSLIFLIRCGRNPIIYDDPAPSPASNIFLQLNPLF
jgi:hypothetical protein